MRKTSAMVRLGIGGAAVVVALAVLTGCGSDENEEGKKAATNTTQAATSASNGAFIGRSQDPNVFVALSVRDGKVLAYACDGTDDHVSVGEWFEGSTSSDAVDVRSKSGGRFEASLTGAKAAGTLTLPGGKKLPFTLMSSTPPARVYVGRTTKGGAPYIARWIVLRNGSIRGAAGPIRRPKSLQPPPPPPKESQPITQAASTGEPTTVESPDGGTMDVAVNPAFE